MRRSLKRGAVVGAAAILLATLATFGDGAVATSKFKLVRTLNVASSATGGKSQSSLLARSDAKLLARTDAAQAPVLVKLDVDSEAAYAGGVPGYAPTSPQASGRKLAANKAAVSRYDGYLASQEAAFAKALARAVPAARITGSLRTVYGGVKVTLPANQAKNVARLKGVVAVQSDSLQKPTAIPEGPQFIGAPAIWSKTGGSENSGAGVLFADLDTGLWPEHPMLPARSALPPARTRPDGSAFGCNYGDNPVTPANDPFVCNNKVVGGYNFLATYNSLFPGTETFATTARDSDGHCTHTTTTTAGGYARNAPIFGLDRGPISGVAPGAQVIEYKVCGTNGCFSSDSAAAVGQAITDGVDAINFSISGGSDPTTDPVELAVLDAVAANVFVAASAGNSGPTAGTANHGGPWTTTVAASTQTRAFETTLTLDDGSGPVQFTGSSLTLGLSTPAPVVMGGALGDAYCGTALPAGSVSGKAVACQRGNGIGRVQKGYNVLQGGAVAMILYNLPLQDTETDNHFLPAVHLADGTAFLAYMTNHPNALASFPAGAKTAAQGDVMAAFSSRGPLGNFVKPDITAPGVQVLAGNTPVPDDVAAGPPGQYFQAIAGTSMSSPHIAGSALLMRALHPSWTPMQIKSAIMTTATQSVVKEDLVTPADPFDFGAGRVDLTTASKATLTLDETLANFNALTGDPAHAVDLNIASVDAPIMPGGLVTHRRVTNSGTSTRTWKVATSVPSGSKIKVTPSSFTLAPGATQDLTIAIESSAATGTQIFGEIRLIPNAGVASHLPVAFVPTQGAVTLAQACDNTTVPTGGTTTCTVTAQNQSNVDTVADLSTKAAGTVLGLVSSSGASTTGPNSVGVSGVSLNGHHPGNPSFAPGTTPAGGFLDLALFGVAADPIGDEQIINYNIPAVTYASDPYTMVGVDSNGYLVMGGGTGQDNQCCPPQVLPDPNRPNNVIAPFWSDLDGSGAPGIRAAELTDGTNTWIVLQWEVAPYGIPGTPEVFQVWLGEGSVEDVSWAYGNVTAPPSGYGLVVGVENADGSAGQTLGSFPSGDYQVSSTPGAPGGSYTYTVTYRGNRPGNAIVVSTMTSPVIAGTTVVRTPIQVT